MAADPVHRDGVWLAIFLAELIGKELEKRSRFLPAPTLCRENLRAETTVMCIFIPLQALMKGKHLSRGLVQV